MNYIVCMPVVALSVTLCVVCGMLYMCKSRCVRVCVCVHACVGGCVCV